MTAQGDSGLTLLSVELVLLLHERALYPGELSGMAADKSLESSLARVENRLAYGLIDDIYDLAAAYTAAISQGHCFNDGNKRTAFLALDVFLGLNGAVFAWDVEDVGQRVIQLAQRKIDEADFSEWLRSL